MSSISRLLWPNVEIEMHALSVCNDTSWAWRRRWKLRGAMGTASTRLLVVVSRICQAAGGFIAILHLYFPQKGWYL